MDSDVRVMEVRLREAMLQGNVEELDALIHDRLVFVGSEGSVYRKQDDLALYRTGQQKLTRVDLMDVRIEPHGATAVAVVAADLAGTFKGQEFEGRFRYIRTWIHDGQGWQIIAGSVCAVAA